VIGALHMEEEYPPPDLAAGALSIIGRSRPENNEYYPFYGSVGII